MLKSKTFWTGIITGIGAITKGAGLDVPNEFFILMGAIGGIFMRLGIKKGEIQ